VAVTAVYYHFTGKEDLFGAAMRKVLDNISTVVETVRPSAGKSSPDDLSAVIDAVWDWTDANPAQAALVHAQLPGGTLQMSTIRHEFQSRHVQRASALFGGAEGVRGFYVAVAPQLYAPICANLGLAGLGTPNSRVVLEKPIGKDLAASCAINDAVAAMESRLQAAQAALESSAVGAELAASIDVTFPAIAPQVAPRWATSTPLSSPATARAGRPAPGSS